MSTTHKCLRPKGRGEEGRKLREKEGRNDGRKEHYKKEGTLQEGRNITERKEHYRKYGSTDGSTDGRKGGRERGIKETMARPLERKRLYARSTDVL